MIVSDNGLATGAAAVLTDLADLVPQVVPVTSPAGEPPMTEDEYDRLADLEANISDCWWEMGIAFAEIRDKKLYRCTPDGEPQTWEDYCKKKHKRSKQYVDRLIRAAESVKRMAAETIVSVLPATPSQAHELVGLNLDEMATATRQATNTAKTEGRKPTAQDFRSAAASVKANQPRTPSPTADATDTRRTTSQSGPADTGRYAVTIKTAETSDEAVVAQILKDLNIQFVTRKVGPVTRIVCKPSKTQMTGLLTNLGTWLDTNTPGDFEVRVGR